MEQSVNVELVNVTKYYGKQCLFEGMSVKLHPGECLAVIGPNGSGKSTFLKIIAGFVKPSAGTVRLLSNSNREISQYDQVGNVGFVSPELVFYNPLTGCENIDFLTRAAGVAVSPKDITTCFQTMGLAGREHDTVMDYSTGMRQRLKFALLLALNPPLWLLDEPSSNLDTAGKRLVGDLIHKALASNTAIIIATNEGEEADYAQKKICLA